MHRDLRQEDVPPSEKLKSWSALKWSESTRLLVRHILITGRWSPSGASFSAREARWAPPSSGSSGIQIQLTGEAEESQRVSEGVQVLSLPKETSPSVPSSKHMQSLARTHNTAHMHLSSSAAT